jgi:hypothetical protein
MARGRAKPLWLFTIVANPSGRFNHGQTRGRAEAAPNRAASAVTVIHSHLLSAYKVQEKSIIQESDLSNAVCSFQAKRSYGRAFGRYKVCHAGGRFHAGGYAHTIPRLQ